MIQNAMYYHILMFFGNAQMFLRHFQFYNRRSCYHTLHELRNMRTSNFLYAIKYKTQSSIVVEINEYCVYF